MPALIVDAPLSRTTTGFLIKPCKYVTGDWRKSSEQRGNPLIYKNLIGITWPLEVQTFLKWVQIDFTVTDIYLRK